MARPASIVKIVREAMGSHLEEAKLASRLFRSWVSPTLCEGPGMATMPRLAVRCAEGRDTEGAAAREYLYRWSLALTSPVFGVPHTLGL